MPSLFGAPRDALALSALLAVALAFSVQSYNYFYLSSTQQDQHPLAVRSQTFCYDGITTLADPTADTSGSGSEGAKAGSTVGPPTCFTVGTDGRFSKVWTPGEDEELSAETHKGWAIPGLWDGHGHLLPYGEFLHSVDLFGSSSFDEIRRRIRDYLAAHPGAGSPQEWIRGVGWDQMALGGMPTAALLEEDPALRGLHILLDRVDVHCVWASQAVLDLLPADLPDVPGGEIVRSPGMGVFCDNAIDVVSARWPKPGPARKREFVRSAMQSLHAVGLVGMHDAGAVTDDLALYADMARQGAAEGWTLRVYAMLECRRRNTFCEDEIPEERDVADRFWVKSVKLFADGALGSWGSAMLEPYSDRPSTSGSLLVNASTLTSITRSWAAAGFQVNIHAIGDLANRLALDAFEAALADACSAPEAGVDEADDPRPECHAAHRFRIEHTQIIHPTDRKRLLALGVIPSIQPTHATSDMKYAELRLGPERTARSAYRMRSLLPARPVLGSDFPVEPPDPFQGIYAAVARKSPATGRGADGGTKGWYTGQTLSVSEALVGFTRNVAHGAFLEGQAGVIQDGAFADWVVLEKRLEEYDVEELRNMKVKETWVGGNRVFCRDC